MAGPAVLICDDCITLGASTADEQTDLASMPTQAGAEPAIIRDADAACSFCPNPKSDVSRLFVGGEAPKVFICIECINVCVGVIQRRDGDDSRREV